MSKFLGFLYTFPEPFHRILFDLTDHVIAQCVDEDTHKILVYKWIDGKPLINIVNKIQDTPR